MSLLVKICGINSREALAAAIDAGADAIGFVFHGSSVRNMVPAEAAALAARLPPGIQTVAVTMHPEQKLVDQVLAEFLPCAWQTDAADFERLELPAGVQRWPVIRAGQAQPRTLPGRLLFEGARSGAGEMADWAQAARLARRAELILAGGLAPENVAAAIRRVSPYGVDVSSGVESAPGHKDPLRIEQFVKVARAAAGVTA